MHTLDPKNTDRQLQEIYVIGTSVYLACCKGQDDNSYNILGQVIEYGYPTTDLRITVNKENQMSWLQD